MRAYSIDYKRSAIKELKAIRDLETALEIKQAIEDLAILPRPPGVKKLQGQADLWRIRIGNWRVVYQIEDGRLLILVVRVAQRGQVYRGI